MTRTITIFEFNLGLQLLVFFLFLAGIYYVRAKKNLKRHRLLMVVATVLNAISIVFIMGRAFLTYFGSSARGFYEPSLLMIGIHGVLGSLAETLGVSFLRKHSANVRSKMRIAAALWTIALLLGIAFYAYSYLS